MPAYSFPALLKELGERLDIPNLEPSQYNNAALKLKGGVNVLLQAHKTDPYLIASFEISDLQAGRYRENVLREALKFNSLNQSHQGIFGYNKINQKFYLFDMIAFEDTTPEQVHTILLNLSVKVKQWKEAFERGEIPVIEVSSHPQTGGGIFGIHP